MQFAYLFKWLDYTGQNIWRDSYLKVKCEHLKVRKGVKTRVARWYMYFQTKNPNLGKFWWQWKMLVYFMSIWYTYFIAIWYNLRPFGIFSVFGIFFLFWYLVTIKIWQPWSKLERNANLKAGHSTAEQSNIGQTCGHDVVGQKGQNEGKKCDQKCF
jgi:hypothetical protein